MCNVPWSGDSVTVAVAPSTAPAVAGIRAGTNTTQARTSSRFMRSTAHAEGVVGPRGWAGKHRSDRRVVVARLLDPDRDRGALRESSPPVTDRECGCGRCRHAERCAQAGALLQLQAEDVGWVRV